MKALALLLIGVLSSLPGQAVAQPAPSAPPPSGAARWSVGLEYQRDRFEYHFDNPSSFNTPELVPHAFEQRYDADNTWLSGLLQFTLGTRPFETEGGFTAAATGVASDYDTFYQPDGNIIVYGTTADTDVRSWRAAQYVGLGSWLGLRWRAAYSYRRDRAGFRPSFTTITQTTPPSASAFWNTDRESTVSEVHEIRIGVDRRFDPGPGWDARFTADVAPTTLARLSVSLPDKYPEPVTFIAKGLSANAAFRITRRFGPWRAGAVVVVARAWSYTDGGAYRRRAASVAATVGRQPAP